jgi:hypothetical protein
MSKITHKHKPNSGSVFLKDEINGTRPCGKGSYRQGLSDELRELTLWPSAQLRPVWPKVIAMLREHGLDDGQMRFQVTTSDVWFGDQSPESAVKRRILQYNQMETCSEEDDANYAKDVRYIEVSDPQWLVENVDGFKVAPHVVAA